jgi:RNA polymerase sigma-70 factor (ECF subfamily)
VNHLEERHRLADWFRQWRLPLRKFLIGRGTVPTSDIDDVAQEVFLRLMRYGKAELIEHPQAYLYKMAANVAAEWAIRSRYTRSRDREWLIGFLGEEQGDHAVDQASQVELQDDIEQALMSLTPQQRLVLKLQFYGGLSRSEVAAQTGLSERSVKRSLLKSYEKLRQRLNTEPFTESIDEHK